MKFSKIIAKTGEWLGGDGPHRQIVVTSRVRLARNLKGKAFPGWAKKAERIEVLKVTKAAVMQLSMMHDAFLQRTWRRLRHWKSRCWSRRHLISREHAAKGVGSAVVMNPAQSLSFMINEEDHLRMQAICGGLQLGKVFTMINQADSELGALLDFAFHSKLGYLTACPTNVGTGMRASAMLHLPGLVMSDQMNKIINSVNKIGLAVRGLHGEGTEAMGNLVSGFQSDYARRGEEEIIERLKKVIETIIEHEQNARLLLLQRKPIAPA